MPDRGWLTFSFPTPLIFRYHLSLNEDRSGYTTLGCLFFLDPLRPDLIASLYHMYSHVLYPSWPHRTSLVWRFIIISASVADPGCLSRIRLFSIPDPNCLHPRSRIRIKEFKYDPRCSSLIPDPDADFLPIPDPGSRGQKGTGSRIRIRNTDFSVAGHVHQEVGPEERRACQVSQQCSQGLDLWALLPTW